MSRTPTASFQSLLHAVFLQCWKSEYLSLRKDLTRTLLQQRVGSDIAGQAMSMRFEGGVSRQH